MNVLAPIFEGLFINDSYACRVGKGQHKGSARTMQFVRRNKYCLKMDIRKFYPSVNHEVLLSIIRRKIKCKNTLWLIEEIINSFPGESNVPIGNFTSQWFGNLYLNELDTLVKQELRIKDYLRYCDDFCLFHNDKQKLNEAKEIIEKFVLEKLKMTLSKNDLFPTSRGVDFLGYRHFNNYILLRKSTAKRVKKRLPRLLSKYQKHEISKEQFRSSIGSTIGWIKWANTFHLKSCLRLDNMVQLAQAAGNVTEVCA
jgi:retron-type reverse transcriptase